MSGRMMAWKRVGILCDGLEWIGILFDGYYSLAWVRYGVEALRFSKKKGIPTERRYHNQSPNS
jgi:hypothetical protein